MTRSDWLVGGDRRTVAAERIYAAASDLIARGGMDAFDIDALATRVHCSRRRSTAARAASVRSATP
jgi:hypothetical protein